MFVMGLLIFGCDREIVDVDSVESDALMEEGLDTFEGLDGTGVSQEVDSVIESGFDWYNHPDRFEEDYVYTFTDLPLGGNLEKTPWSGDYWAKNKGGISYRWQTDERFTYTSYTEDELKMMSSEEISLLSPAEKYDILVEHYDYPLNTRALASGNTNEAAWAGYCHGWAPAAHRYEEPKPMTLTNGDGIEIPFGSSDIKALLTYFEGEVANSTFVGHDWSSTIYSLGSTCFSAEILDPACHDSNPAAFHVVLTNRIGIMDMGFNMDVDKGYEKWNQPVYAYRSQILTTRPPSGQSADETVVEYIMETEVHWAMEIHPMWEPVLLTEHQNSESKTYTYSIEVDKDGEIIGGQWLTPTQQGGYANIQQVWNYFVTLDENGDDQPDLNEDEVNANTSRYFEIPDYLWYQDDISIEYDFEPLAGPYDILSTTSSSRELLLGYFGALQDLIED